MRKTFLVMAMVIALALSMVSTAMASDHCETVDTSRGALTAHLVNPGTVTGPVDGSPCQIAVYFDEPGTVDAADITVNSTAQEHFGVFVDGSEVDVVDSTFGLAFVHVLYANGASGTIDGNVIDGHERNAVVVSGAGSDAVIKNNTVQGDGDRKGKQGNRWAQNGIQVSYGASGNVSHNTVTDHWWGGDNWASSGIMVFESDNVTIAHNTSTGNERGVGIESWAWVEASADENSVVGNTIADSMVGISVHTYAVPGYAADNPTANDNAIINNTIEGSTHYGISVGAFDYDYDDDFDPSTDNTKLIRNRTGDDGVKIWDGASATKLPKPFS